MPVHSWSRSQLGWWLELTDTVSNSVFILHLLLKFLYFDIDTVMKTQYGKGEWNLIVSLSAKITCAKEHNFSLNACL